MLSRLRRFAVRHIEVIIPALMLLVVVGFRMREPALIEQLRNLAFDSYQRFKPRPNADAPVLIVDVDEESLAKIGQWPWPRDVFANLIDRLGDLGAKVVVFDVLFSEADRLSPPRYADLIEPINRQVATVLRYMPGNEEIMGDAMRRHPVVLGSAGTNQARRDDPDAFIAKGRQCRGQETRG